MAASGSHWVAICQDCGQPGNSGTSANQNPPPGKPNISGKCKSSLTGEHRPRWEKR